MKILQTVCLILQTVAAMKSCYAPGQGVDISKRVKASTMVVNGIVSYVGNPDENGIYNATILVRKTWSKKNDDIKDNVVLRLGPFGTDKKCPSVKHRMSYIFFIRNSGRGKETYASEQNLKKTAAILGEKDPNAVAKVEMLPQKSIHSTSPEHPQYNKAGCLVLEAPENGDMSCMANGKQCNFKCDPGYTMVGFHRKICMGRKVGWKPFKPVLCKGEDSLEMALINAATTVKEDNSMRQKLLIESKLKSATPDSSVHTVSTTETAASVFRNRPLPNLKFASDAGQKMDELLKQKMIARTTPRTTTTAAPLEAFFTDLQSECKIKKGTYRRGNAWNQGFDGSVQVNPTQRISEWTLVLTFSAPVTSLALHQERRYVLRKSSANKRTYAITVSSYQSSQLFPGYPLEVDFTAKHMSFVDLDVEAVLYYDCAKAVVEKKPVSLGSSPFSRLSNNRWGVRSTVAPKTTAVAPRKFAAIGEIYTGDQLSDGVQHCSAWEPAGRLPGTGQVYPRWISSVFKSAVRYDYNEVMSKSLLFLNAQRSGALPEAFLTDCQPQLEISFINFRLLEQLEFDPWRGDSGLKDGCLEAVDLSGGWYHDGGHVKHALPTASAATMLLWGMIDYKDAYAQSNEFEFAKNQLKWIVDYYMKAHTGKFELYVQVGDVKIDDNYWGRPEEMNMDRPAFKISPEYPGSDIAAEIAATFAAASMVFADDDELYAAKCLEHARDLWEFASTYQGSYSAHIETGEKFQPETGYMDELVWGALWIYKATADNYYLDQGRIQHCHSFGEIKAFQSDNRKYYSSLWDHKHSRQAERLFSEHGFYSPRVFSWDDKRAGNLVLLAKFTGKKEYKSQLNQFLNWLMESAYRTPKGLIYLDDAAPNRHAANAAVIALQAASIFTDYRTMLTKFAQQQVHYMLGDSGRSYVVGFGVNPPQRAYHRGSSCPDVPKSCSWEQMKSTRANPQVLFGALVAGPDRLDNYEDRRDRRFNDVGVDHTAGLLTAVAGLKQDSQKARGFRILGSWKG
ncbi:Oidioi.mRNA.OKI2018_I69.chr1.g3900.t2.cds [Oikopleura dioica]|uniref:cellulase n=1 Tax=Oikopleura dioica TaxID=34765 RepID=A0ABN7SVG8_OIKDI|nr:Oidioi.mRNA.OKI2018_I69.chr1.g3900.t2.cds [Oikopleura dioica]